MHHVNFMRNIHILITSTNYWKLKLHAHFIFFFFNKKCDNKIVIKHLYTVYRMSEMNHWDIKESLRARGLFKAQSRPSHKTHCNYDHEFLQGHSLSLSLSCSLHKRPCSHCFRESQGGGAHLSRCLQVHTLVMQLTLNINYRVLCT